MKGLLDSLRKLGMAPILALTGVIVGMIGIVTYLELGGVNTSRMALLYGALEKTKGDTDGTKLVEAMKGMSWMSPRGPISIDPETRDIVQNVYIRKVERKNGQLYNVEFATIPNVKDPFKAAKAAAK